MPKQKTHKMTAKKLNVRPGGTITRGCAGGNHKTGKKNASYNRTFRKGSKLSSGDYNRLKKVL